MHCHLPDNIHGILDLHNFAGDFFSWLEEQYYMMSLRSYSISELGADLDHASIRAISRLQHALLMYNLGPELRKRYGLELLKAARDDPDRLISQLTILWMRE